MIGQLLEIHSNTPIIYSHHTIMSPALFNSTTTNGNTSNGKSTPAKSQAISKNGSAVAKPRLSSADIIHLEHEHGAHK